MSGYFIKNVASSFDFTFDWGARHLETGEEIATDLGWTVDPETVGGLAIGTTSATLTTTTASLEAGRPGDAYRVKSLIETTTGRRLERSLTVRIGNN